MAMLRRALLVAVLVLTACGDDDGGGGDAPPREGVSTEYASAWVALASERCGEDVPTGCGLGISSREDDMPATEVDASNLIIGYDPTFDNADGDGWAVLQELAAEVGCTLPEEQPTEPIEEIDCQTSAEPDDDSSSSGSFDEDAVREYIAENMPTADVDALVQSVREGCLDYTVRELTTFLALDEGADGSLLPLYQAGCPDKVAEAGY